ncbi:MAG: CoB--CoM heterodisulfide reductase iron-sulfur subunit A family protein [Acidobacteria bacterium]|nr:CoB--CoM heterodisulfide reductase iron-sulfur subunit A family protein [Acidobacteriota bacterium]
MASQRNDAGDQARIGVFICHCGGNVSDVVDVERVAKEIGKKPNVVHSCTHMFMCSDPGQALIEEKIKEMGLNRVIVAACSPTLHQLTFRRTLDRAGLNQFLFEHVNVREQVSWVVEDREEATRKATRLVSAAVGRIRHLVPLDKRRIKIHPAALVLGGGVAGLVAARNLARRGMRVNLVEQTPFLGGRMAQLDKLFPSNESARELLCKLIHQVIHQPLITVYTNAQVIESEGIVGDFRTKVRLIPRGVNHHLTYAGNAIAACPEETISEFNFGLTKRKAIYMPYPGCYPQMPAIDWRSCTKCGKCAAAVSGRGISLDDQPTEIEIKSGVIVLATGYDPYEPLYGEYGYGIFPEVLTLQQLVRILDEEGPTGGRLLINNKPVRSMAFIHCAGARQYEGINMPQPDGTVNDYCARTCCTAALHNIDIIKQRYPDIRIFDLYQDIRTYGRGHEDYYEKASEHGVIFLRFDPFDLPTVRHDTQEQTPLLVKTRDLLTDRLEMEIPVDVVVLATGVVPHDISELVDMFKCAVGYDNFLLEVHPKLRPVELAVSGVFLAGSCQGPMDTTETCAAAAAAASKAAALIAQGQVEMDPFIAKVNEEKCTGCQTCLSVCPYSAITRDERKGVAVVNEALCTGCGTCAAACPSNAIHQFGFTDDQILSEVEMLLSDSAVG